MSAGIYIHIPFCKSRCSYCDFATDVYRNNEAVERYVTALINEISNFGSQVSDLETPKKEIADHRLLITNYCFETIYFGGGTPSLLTPKQLEKITDAIYQKFDVQKNIEFTLEMNPGTVSLEKLEDYKSLGVNRASFGVQTFDNRALKLLARGHDANDAKETFKFLRQTGFENISFDLIAGLPGQTLTDWEKNLDEALELKPEHLSLYLLEIHEGTPIAEQVRSKRQPKPDEDLAGEMYELMIDRVAEKGFEQYEISNFTKSGFESKHNNKYWLCEPVIGFGCSAHSFDGKTTRWANERDTNKYVSLIEENKTPIIETTKLTQKQLSGEYAFLNLRLKSGLNFNKFAQKFGYDLRNVYAKDFDNFEKLGLIELTEEVLKLTRKGFVYSNEVFSIFV